MSLFNDGFSREGESKVIRYASSNWIFDDLILCFYDKIEK